MVMVLFFLNCLVTTEEVCTENSQCDKNILYPISYMSGRDPQCHQPDRGFRIVSSHSSIRTYNTIQMYDIVSVFPF